MVFGYDDNYLFENHYILSQRPSLVAAEHNINSIWPQIQPF